MKNPDLVRFGLGISGITWFLSSVTTSVLLGLAEPHKLLIVLLTAFLPPVTISAICVWWAYLEVLTTEDQEQEK